jgi:hypothetical protein
VIRIWPDLPEGDRLVIGEVTDPSPCGNRLNAPIPLLAGLIRDMVVLHRNSQRVNRRRDSRKEPTMATSKGRRTRRTQTRQNGATRADNAAPDNDSAPRADSPAEAVWGALTANPRASVTEIAVAAGVSKTVARRELTALESDGRATRARTGGKATPDTWAPTTGATTGATTEDAADDAADGAADTADAVDAGAANALPVDAPEEASGTKDEPASSAPDADGTTSAKKITANPDSGEQDGPGEGMDPSAVAEARDTLTAMRDVITSALAALEAGDGAKADAAVELVYGASGKARRQVRAAARGRVRTASGRAKSAPGELRTKVAAHLKAYPDTEFTPHEIGKAIGHSAGAVANALERLVALDEAVCTTERPRRFTAATPPAAATPGTGDSAYAAAATAAS